MTRAHSSLERFLLWNMVCLRAAMRAAEPRRVAALKATLPSIIRLLLRRITPSFRMAAMLQAQLSSSRQQLAHGSCILNPYDYLAQSSSLQNQTRSWGDCMLQAHTTGGCQQLTSGCRLGQTLCWAVIMAHKACKRSCTNTATPQPLAVEALFM